MEFFIASAGVILGMLGYAGLKNSAYLYDLEEAEAKRFFDKMREIAKPSLKFKKDEE